MPHRNSCVKFSDILLDSDPGSDLDPVLASGLKQVNRILQHLVRVFKPQNERHVIELTPRVGADQRPATRVDLEQQQVERVCLVKELVL